MKNFIFNGIGWAVWLLDRMLKRLVRDKSHQCQSMQEYNERFK